MFTIFIYSFIHLFSDKHTHTAAPAFLQNIKKSFIRATLASCCKLLGKPISRTQMSRSPFLQMFIRIFTPFKSIPKPSLMIPGCVEKKTKGSNLRSRGNGSCESQFWENSVRNGNHVYGKDNDENQMLKTCLYVVSHTHTLYLTIHLSI